MSLLRCTRCGWVHMGRTLAEVEEEVRSFNEFYDQASPETRANYGGRASTDGYKQCFRCGAPHTLAEPAITAPEGSTLQPLLAPEWT